MIDPKLKKRLESRLGKPVKGIQPLGGGSIAATYRLQTGDDAGYLVKTGAAAADMFPKEAHGLQELAAAGAIRVPEVIAAEANYLLLEYIPQSRPGKDFFARFGRAFAGLHRRTGTHFGFREDNYIGATPQVNVVTGDARNNWAVFYLEYRLRFQIRLAEKRGLLTSRLGDGFQKLEPLVVDLLTGSEESPALLHGDLWSGNFLVDDSGAPCLIDPAVYYGHREADLAMTRLFGGFDDSFYRAYQETYPLPGGYRERENLYMLYHVLNHLNLFGSSYAHKRNDLSGVISDPPPVVIIVHRTERPQKCTVLPLRGRPGLEFHRYPFNRPLVLSGYVRIGIGGPLLSMADREKGLLLLDATWKRVRAMERSFPDVPVRSLPHWKTAYPRSSQLREDPANGLATVEALFAALSILGRDTNGILTHYHWKDAFLHRNRNRIDSPGNHT